MKSYFRSMLPQTFVAGMIQILTFAFRGATWPARALTITGTGCAILTLCAMGALAQQSVGTVSGNVTDIQSAVVVDASLTLSSLSQTVERTVKSNARGEYLFTNVTPGDYMLTISASTFERFVVERVHVDANENVRIDGKLKPGSADVTVTIDAPSITVDTQSATVAAVIDPTLVENLPVDGNNVVALAALLPGVTNVNAPTTYTSDTGGPSYTVSGSRSNQNLFLLDGLMWNNVYYNTGLNFPPGQALQEVSVQLANYKAQYGRNVGSVFNAISKSGTNKIHGMLWEYMQNKALNAADYISHLNPKQVQNQFGASLGGPILKNKAYFFLTYQDLRLASVVFSNSVLPTPAERGLMNDLTTPRPCTYAVLAGKTCASFIADFPADTDPLTGYSPRTPNTLSYILNPLSPPGTAGNPGVAMLQLQSAASTAAGAAQGNAACITDLQNVQIAAGKGVMPYAEIPTECFNPVTINALKKYVAFPTLNGSLVTTPIQAPTTANQPRNDQSGFARMDVHLPGHSIDARLFITNANDTTANSVSATALSDATYGITLNMAHLYAGSIGDTWVIAPNLLNVLRSGYKRYVYTVNPTDHTTIQDLGAQGIDTIGNPTLPILVASSRFRLGSNAQAYSYNVNANFELDDALTWQHGNHNFQFGAQFLDMQYIRRFDMVPSLSTASGFTGNVVSDLEMGLIQSVTVGNSTNIGAQDHVFYFYGQDDWRVAPRLTLNLGLRYELPFPWTQPDGQSVTFVNGYQSYKFPNSPANLAFAGDPGIPEGIIKTTHSNLAPRVGLSYDLFGTGRTAIRAGFGIFYDAMNASTTGFGLPYHYQATYSAPTGGLSKPLLGLSPVPPNYTDAKSATFPTPYYINFADPNVTDAYSEAINVGIQQRISKATLEVLYVGKFGRHQLVPYDLNPSIYDCSGKYYQINPAVYCSGATNNSDSQLERATFPGFNVVGMVDQNSVGTSSYNGGQLIYTQRSRFLTATGSYTYSRSLDLQSNGNTTGSSTPQPWNLKSQYGPSDFQATHIFNIGWNLNFPAVRKGSRFERAILNNWSSGGIFSARTGNPFNPYYTTDVSYSGEPNQRPPLAPGLTHYVPYPSNRHRVDKVNSWFNYASFDPAPGKGYYNVFGEVKHPVSRNCLYGPAFMETDLRVDRGFKFEHGMAMHIRADAFNVWNTPNLGQPLPNITSNVANNYTGQITATVGRNGTVGTNGRRVQLNLVIQF